MTFDKTRRHRISGDTVIDYIDPTGEVIPNIDSGPFKGVRQKLLTP